MTLIIHINYPKEKDQFIPIRPECCNVPFFFETLDLEYTQAGGKPQKFFNGFHECGERIHLTTN